MDLTEYLNRSIEALIKSALRAAVFKPNAVRFITGFGGAQAAARDRRIAHEQEGLHVPPFLIAGITAGCNLRCAGCYAQTQGCGCGAELPAERWSGIFSQAQELGVAFILLAGGEPLLRHDVLEAATRFPKMVFPVFTNGTLLDAEKVRFFEKNRNLVPFISIEGGNATTDRRRGSGVYGSTQRAMAELRHADVLFGASVTVTRENMPEVTEAGFIAGLREAGCDAVIFVEYVPVGADAGMEALSDCEREELNARIEALRGSQQMLLVSFPGDEKETGGCVAAGRGFIYIEPDGRAEPCPFSPFSDISLADCTLEQALRSGFFARLRDYGILSQPHDGGCLLFQRQEQVKAELAEGE
ncbi:MAG: radical SAM/SPASM domain-containing protein [Clostridia bacterium]|nr:radical SAM/SPASM domain-containing protein [Clostridia bacterium]